MIARVADDDVSVEGRARWARAWEELVAAAATVLRYRCVSPAGDLWQSPACGAPQPLSRLVHEIRRALRAGGPKRRGFELALVAAERALVGASGWALVSDFDDVERYASPDGEVMPLARAAAVCRAAVLREERLALGVEVTADGPALVRDGYDQRQAEGCDEVQRAPVDDGGVWAGDDCEGAPAPDDGLSVHGACVTPSFEGGECA